MAYLRAHDGPVWPAGERLRFNAPKGALTRGRQAELARYKVDLIEFPCAADAATLAVPASVQPAPRTGPLRLSSPQERLWFPDPLTADTATFNLALTRSFHRSFVVTALGRAFTEILRRQAVLRIEFVI